MFFMFLISDKNVFYVVLLSHRCFFYKMVKLQEKTSAIFRAVCWYWRDRQSTWRSFSSVWTSPASWWTCAAVRRKLRRFLLSRTKSAVTHSVAYVLQCSIMKRRRVFFHWSVNCTASSSLAWAKSMLCFANVILFIYFFNGRLMLRPRLTGVRETFTRGGPWVWIEKLLLGFFPGHP